MHFKEYKFFKLWNFILNIESENCQNRIFLGYFAEWHCLDVTLILFIEPKFIAYQNKLLLSYDVASGSEITPCIKINKPLVVHRFSGRVKK